MNLYSIAIAVLLVGAQDMPENLISCGIDRRERRHDRDY